MILVICDEGRYIPVQFVNVPDFSVFDLPRCLQLVKQKANAPVVAVEIDFYDNGELKIQYLAKRRCNND